MNMKNQHSSAHRVSFWKKLWLEHQQMVKPTAQQLIIGALTAFIGAVVMACSVSAVDTAFTAFVELFV